MLRAVFGGASRWRTLRLLLLELSCRTSHLTASSSAAFAAPCRTRMVCCSAYVTSSGRLCAELPSFQASTCGFDSKILENCSSVAEGGIVVPRDRGRCRPKNEDMRISVGVISIDKHPNEPSHIPFSPICRTSGTEGSPAYALPCCSSSAAAAFCFCQLLSGLFVLLSRRALFSFCVFGA